MITWVVLAPLAYIVCSYLYNLVKWTRRANRLTANVAGWRTLPLLGNAVSFMGDNKLYFKRVEEISEETDKKGGRFKAWLGPELFFFTTLPEDIKAINNTFLEKPSHYNFVDLWIKNGLTNAPVELWKKLIKKVHVAFTSAMVDDFQDTFNSHAKKIVYHLTKEVGKQPFDAYRKYIAFVTLEAICTTVLGVTDFDEVQVTVEYYNAYDRLSSLLMLRMKSVLGRSEALYRLTSGFREFKRCVDILKQMSTEVIRRKRKEIEDKKTNMQATNLVTDVKLKSLLAHLIKLSETDPDMTDQQIQAITDNFIGAGQETTALTSSLIFIALGSNIKAQDELYAEMKKIFGDSERDVTIQDLDRMDYCEAVILETLRLYPIIPMLMRYAKTDLELDGCTIPEGTNCVVFAWGSGRSRRLWGEDALEFRPERWLKGEQPHSAAFSTFSYGKRACIGKKYAMNFLKTTVAYAIRRLVVKSDASKLDFQLNITIHPISGHQIQVDYRKPVRSEGVN